MSNDTPNMNDPLAFLRNMWSGMGVSMPGMVTPTFDVDELDKRIKDMKAVEAWLRMNLSMLQMTIQGLEMQRTTLDAVQAMGKMASDATRSMQAEAATPQAEAASATPDPEKNPFSGAADAATGAAMWPWQMMQQMREQMQQSADAAEQAASEKKPAGKAPARRPRK
ncbi:MAG: PhaM family polyhydroxyalkanoate granule multifunctional regulatory protein [Azonexus sp.]